MTSSPPPQPWILTASILLFLNFVLFVVWGIQYYRLRKKKMEQDGDLAKHYFHCKSIFFKTLLVLLLVRFCQYTLLLLLNIFDLPTSISILFIDIQGAAAGLYLLVYATLLLFWFSFLKIVSTRSLEAVEKPYFYLFCAQVIVVFFIFANLLVCYYFYGAEREEGFYIIQLVGFGAFLVTMAIEILLALILGYRVYKLLNTNRGYSYLNHLSNRSVQVVLISLAVTVMFLLRIVLMVYAFVPVVELGYHPTQGDAYQWYTYSVGHLPYLLYFLLGEDIPIACLIFFQARLPEKNRQPLLFSLEPDEQQNSLQESMFLSP